MLNSDSIIDKIQELKSLSYVKQVEDSNEDYLYLFVSYDLVNSTKFKSDNLSIWPIVYNKFYDLLRKENQSKIKNINIWKYIGDEILFYKKINKSIELYEIFSQVDSIIDNIVKGIHNLFGDSVSILSIKSLIWIAPVKYIPSQDLSKVKELKFYNIMFHTYQKPDQLQLDFLGPDIDLGFRLSKYAVKKIIVVSAELALLLKRLETPDGFSQKETFIDNFRIVDFAKLKGIWNDRYYPIIWYYNDWGNLKDNFFYDDQFKDESNIIKKALNESKDIKILESVFKEIKRLSYIDNLKKMIKDPEENDNEKFIQINIPIEKLSEVHCVAIIFNNENNFLIVKRSENRKRFKDLWEFGCGQLKTNMSFESCIKQSYKEDFNLDLDLDTKTLIPVSIYNFSDKEESRVIPGIIFVTMIDKVNEIKLIENKHSEYKWINNEEFNKFDNKDLVDNAKENVDKALKLLRNCIKEHQPTASVPTVDIV